MHKVFVYGTLKRGRGNHGLLTNSRFVGEALTDEPHALITCGFPYLIPADNADESIPTYSVFGEVFEVDDGTLARLDMLEGVDHGHYCRDKINVWMEDVGIMNVFAYRPSDMNGTELPLCPVNDDLGVTYYVY